MIYEAVTAICLATLFLELLFVAGNAWRKDRAERIAFLRGFKKGKCAIIYLSAVPLYCIGHLHAGQDFASAFFGAISKSINLVVLKYDLSSIRSLMDASLLYRNTVYFCFLLVGCNAVILTFSLVGQQIWYARQVFLSVATRRNKLFLFGNNAENIAIYRSDQKKHRCTIVDAFSDREETELYMEEISFISTSEPERLIAQMICRIKKGGRHSVFIINTGSDEKNMKLCRVFADHLQRSDAETRGRLFVAMQIVVFGDSRYEAIYEDIVSGGFGCIRYANKHRMIALDFVQKHPLTGYMGERQIDYRTSLLRDGVDVRMLLIGLGKTNREILCASVSNHQFMAAGEDGPAPRHVKYHIFDKDCTENNKNLNHTYHRYRMECLKRKDLREQEYLPLPPLPASEEYHHVDINDSGFYDEIRRALAGESDDACFAVIAFGSDLENIDMAQKLMEKCREWEIGNLTVFVKARAWHKEETLLEQENCIFIGNELDTVFHIDKILFDEAFFVSQKRNEIYHLEKTLTEDAGAEITEEYAERIYREARRKWLTEQTPMERESNLFSFLGLRFKLNLMGLDFCRAEDNAAPALTEEEYLDWYGAGDLPCIAQRMPSTNRPIVAYTLDFRPSRRMTMALQEHYRWNAFMICRGVIPATREQILNETVEKNGAVVPSNGKNYRSRRHGNLTTYEGLLEFRRMLALRDGVSEEKRDVFRYDYQILDEAWWLLNEIGYKIIRTRR